MSRFHHVTVRGLLPWAEPKRLLGPGEWTIEGLAAHANLITHAAADLDARMRNICIGGSPITVVCQPPLPRPAVRAARTTDARRRRDTTPGFTRPGVRLDEEGKVSLTPEALALEIGRRYAGRSVIDAGCGSGGNAIGFARAGCRVLAIERDPSRLNDARHNAKIYGVAEKIEFVLGDALALAAAKASAETLLFLDPPWGVDWSREGVSLDAFPLVQQVIEKALPRQFWRTVIKLPPSFRVREIEGARAEAVFGAADGDHRRVKFLLLTL